MKNMKKTILLAVILAISVLTRAQEPQTIETFIIRSHDTQWYGQQMKAWQEKVDVNPDDQWAWRNLFRATYYYDQFSHNRAWDGDTSATADVIRRMEKAIPDSYVLNLSKGRFCLSNDSVALRGDNIPRAVELMPSDACAEDVEYLACQLWRHRQDDARIKDLFVATYQKAYFPERILRYNWNTLRSMQPGAVYFANGDNVTAPMKMLQEVMGERTDVTIIPLSFLYDNNFRMGLTRKLGIPSFDADIQDYAHYKGKWNEHYLADIIRHIIHHSHRPTYFTYDVLHFATLDKDSIYNEGLLLKYSNQPYDNFAVAMHNVSHVYHLDYLAEPDFTPCRWESSAQMDLNNVTLLSNLINKFYRKGDTTSAERLLHTLNACIQNSTLEPEAKAYFKALHNEKDGE